MKLAPVIVRYRFEIEKRKNPEAFNHVGNKNHFAFSSPRLRDMGRCPDLAEQLVCGQLYFRPNRTEQSAGIDDSAGDNAADAADPIDARCDFAEHEQSELDQP